MPHLMIDHSDNVPGFEPRAALEAAMGALAATGLFDMATAKASVRRLEVYAVNHPDDASAFIATTLLVLPGRSVEDRARTGQAITDALASSVQLPPGAQVTTEVREMEPATYSKHWSPPAGA